MVKKEEVQKLILGSVGALFLALILSFVTTMKFARKNHNLGLANLGGNSTSSSQKVEGPSEKEFSEMLKNLKVAAEKGIKIPGLELASSQEVAVEKKEEAKEEVATSKNLEPKEEKDANGNLVSRTEYSDETTEVITKYKDGAVYSVETRYLNPESRKAEGHANIEFTNGMRQEVNYVDGVREGVTYIHYANGDEEMTYYASDVLEGESSYTFANGEQEFFTYVKGVPHGEAVYVYKDGRQETYRYENGSRVN